MFKTHPRNQQTPKPNSRWCHESAGKMEAFSSALDPIQLEARSCSGTVTCGRFPKYPDILGATQPARLRRLGLEQHVHDSLPTKLACAKFRFDNAFCERKTFFGYPY